MFMYFSNCNNTLINLIYSPMSSAFLVSPAVVETSSTQHWQTNTQGSDDEVVAGTRAQCYHQLTLFAE